MEYERKPVLPLAGISKEAIILYQNKPKLLSFAGYPHCPWIQD
jgi:hypothetical protein